MRFYQKYLDKAPSSGRSRLMLLIEGMDKSLGDIMDYLDKNNLTENTTHPHVRQWRFGGPIPAPDNCMSRTIRSIVVKRPPAYVNR